MYFRRRTAIFEVDGIHGRSFRQEKNTGFARGEPIVIARGNRQSQDALADAFEIDFHVGRFLVLSFVVIFLLFLIFTGAGLLIFSLVGLFAFFLVAFGCKRRRQVLL